jgi:hypothetical protein
MIVHSSRWLGVTRAWTDLFKAHRGAKVDRYVVETNKLIIRLDKLTGQDVPTETSKRKGEVFTGPDTSKLHVKGEVFIGPGTSTLKSEVFKYKIQ